MSRSKAFTRVWPSIVLLCAVLLSGAIFAETVTSHYDELNRLTSVKYDKGQEIKYTYDEAGNILTVISKAPVASVSREPEEAAAATSHARRN
jgi:YD repeat-containing protein